MATHLSWLKKLIGVAHRCQPTASLVIIKLHVRTQVCRRVFCKRSAHAHATFERHFKHQVVEQAFEKLARVVDDNGDAGEAEAAAFTYTSTRRITRWRCGESLFWGQYTLFARYQITP